MINATHTEAAPLLIMPSIHHPTLDSGTKRECPPLAQPCTDGAVQSTLLCLLFEMGTEGITLSMTSKVAVVQASPVVFDRERTIEKVSALTREAAQQGAKLVLFPEAFISAYPRGLDFGAVVGGRTDAGREDFRRYWESSVDVPGPAVDELSRSARANRIYLVVGVVERDAGTLYCSVLFFGPDGALLGKRRKVMPTGSERMVWGFGDGSTLPVLDTALGKLGAVICWENYLPLLRAA